MLYLGVDLGGTNIKAALVNSEGEILCEAGIPTNLPRPAEAVCDDIATLCLQLAEGKDVAGVGVGCPGTVDGGTVLYSNNLDWHDFAMEEYLAQKIGLPVVVGNDANVAALGEALAGCAKGAQSTVVVTLGTGVGAGVVLDGKLLTGYTGAASEAGHMVVLDTPDAPRCTCGRHGCLEALASATALIRMTKEARLAHPESALNVLAAKPEDVNGRTAFDAAAQGDAAAQQVVDTYIHYLAVGIANLINIFFPEVIGLSGGVANQGENLLKPLRAAVEPMV
ncbi:MAG: ROK family protein, partial [Subdoligranulum variabile]|nr:ROK family protein [Subdoligranulum variabile]